MQPLNSQLEKSIDDRYQTDLRRDMKQLVGVSDVLLNDYKEIKREVENLKETNDSLLAKMKLK